MARILTEGAAATVRVRVRLRVRVLAILLVYWQTITQATMVRVHVLLIASPFLPSPAPLTQPPRSRPAACRGWWLVAGTRLMAPLCPTALASHHPLLMPSPPTPPLPPQAAQESAESKARLVADETEARLKTAVEDRESRLRTITGERDELRRVVETARVS